MKNSVSHCIATFGGYIVSVQQLHVVMGGYRNEQCQQNLPHRTKLCGTALPRHSRGVLASLYWLLWDLDLGAGR